MTDTVSDEHLVSLLSQCAESDEGALAELFHLTASKLMAVQVRILGMNSMAERALHDTYARIWLKSPDYSEALGSPVTWMTSIARNHALNLRRARQNNKNPELEMDETAKLSTTLTDLSPLDSLSEAQPLKACLNDMDVHTRESIVRAYLDGWSLVDLSQNHNKPIDSIQRSMHSGMMAIKGRS